MNIIRVKTLFQKECLRFLRVYNQTIISSVVNALILFIIFTFAFSRGNGNENYKTTVAIGIIIMTALQASYFNTQSTITVAKVLGFMKDYTITPLTTGEIMISFCLASCLRGLIVGFLTFLTMTWFCNFPFANIFPALYYFLSGMLIFAFLGIIIGFSSADFDKAQAYSSYIIVPLTMLSGTFYSVEDLPNFWQKIIMLNPVFYIIDGFRNAIMGFENSIFGFSFTLLCIAIFMFLSVHFLSKNLQKTEL